MPPETWIKTAALVLYVAFLLWRGFRRRAGFASWHMFASAFQSRFDLRVRQEDGSERPLNPWHYLPHAHLGMSGGEMKLFLLYLRRIHGLLPSGRVDVREGMRRYVVKVEDGNVVA